MPKPVIITADSTCDLSQELLDRFHIRTIPLTITLGADSFPDDGSFSPEDMYRRYRADGTLPTTSAPSVQDYVEFFSAILNEGNEIVHLSISAELSSSFHTAQLSAQELTGVYPVDSRMLSTGVGLLAIEGAEYAERGIAAEEIAAHLSALTEKVETSFVLDTLEFMRKGGRCSGIAAFGANLLQLKPALEMKDGKLVVYKKYRGSISQVYRRYIAERLAGKAVRPGHVFITESGEVRPEEIAALKALVRDVSGAREVHHTYAGCTVSSHCGPKTLGVLFIRE